MNIFITGGAGFIGSHLTEKLIAEGHDIHIYDNLHRNALRYSVIKDNPKVTFTQGDILDFSSLSNAMRGADMVIHLAAIAGVSNYYNYPAKTLKVNLIGTYNVLEAMCQLGIKRVIDMSTSETYGVEANGVTEEHFHNIGPAQDKRWSYAGSKIGGEQLVYRYAEEYGWNATIVRPFNIYGPRQIGEGAIANFCKAVIDQSPLRVEGSGIAIRSWCYIDDFIDALHKIITKPHDGIESFNIGNSWSVASTLGLAEEIIRISHELNLFHENIKLEFNRMNFTEIKVRYPDTEKLNKFYNWTPKVNLPNGIRSTLAWFATAKPV